MKIIEEIKYSLLAVLILLLAWEVKALFFLLFVAFLPLLHIVQINQSFWKSFLSFYITFFLFFGFSNLDLFLEGYKTTALVVGLLILPAMWSLPFMLTKWSCKKTTFRFALFAFPFYYTTLEVLNYYWEIAFPWHHLGLALSGISFFEGLFGILGIEGLSFLILFANVSIYYFWLNYKVKSKSRILGAVPITLLLLLLLFLLSIKRESVNNEQIKVAVLHPKSQIYKQIKSDTKGQYEYLKYELERNNFQGADLLVCGEGYLEDMNRFPLIVNELDSHPAIKALKELSVKYQTPILSGAILVEMKYAKTPPTFTAKKKSDGAYFDIYNGSVLISPGDTTAWRSKQKFVPITETFPFLSTFEFLYSKGLIDFQAEKSYGSSLNNEPYRIADLLISPQICFENLFPTALKTRGVKQADLQVLMSNDWSQSPSIIKKQSKYSRASVNSFGVPLVFAAYNQHAYYYGQNEQQIASKNSLSVFEFKLKKTNFIYPDLLTFYHLFYAVSSILFVILFHLKVANINEK